MKWFVWLVLLLGLVGCGAEAQVVVATAVPPTPTPIPTNACERFAEVTVLETAVSPAKITPATTPPPRYAVHTIPLAQ